jgi:hypothetical protein
MPFTRRPAVQPPVNRSIAQSTEPSETVAPATHENGVQDVAQHFSSSEQSPRPLPPMPAPRHPDAARPADARTSPVPPAFPDDVPRVAPMTLKSLKAWAKAPEQSKKEKTERAKVVMKLTNKSLLKSRILNIPYDLDFSRHKELTSLPEGLSIRGSLNLSGCTALTRLPEGLSIQGILNLSGCTAITRLPEGLSRAMAELNLTGCSALTQLPDGLSIEYGLITKGCTALTQLPARLSVGESINMEGCTALTRLPEDLLRPVHLELRNCTSLTQLPAYILQWPSERHWTPHIIDISGSGIRPETIQAMGHIGPGVQLIHDVHEARSADDPQFTNLSNAMAFWRPLASPAARANTSGSETPPDLHASPQQLISFLAFLSRLRGTADFQNSKSRPLLAQRIVGLTDQLAASESLAALCHERIGQALESCGDRVIWAMNQIELAVRVHEAQQGTAPEQRLRDLGLSLLRLQVVHQHAAAKVASLRVVDPIEVYLAYETRLAQPLKLPLSTQGMLYERISNITEADLDAASRAAKQADADPKQVEAYLATWEPWQALLRHQQAVACTWQSLPPLPKEVSFTDDQVCILTQEIVAELRATGSQIAAAQSANGQWEPYDFKSLIKWWTQEGTHPLQGTLMRLEDIHRPA